MTTVKVAKKDVEKFNKVINDFSGWMKENTPPPTLLDDDYADWEHDNLESK